MSVSSITYLGYNVPAQVASLDSQGIIPCYFQAAKKRHLSGKRGANDISAKSDQMLLTVGNFREHVRHFIPEPTYRLVYAFDLPGDMSC
ncbi:hypothetical protein D3C73_662220 [compost metagenome]